MLLIIQGCSEEIFFSNLFDDPHPRGHTWRYTRFCAHYKAFAATLKRSMRQHRRAGEKMFIDYAGSTVALSDGSQAQIFVSAMAVSSCVFGHDTETTCAATLIGVGHDDRNERSRSPKYAVGGLK